MTEQYATATGRYGKAVDHEDLVATIAALAAEGETLLGGGVSLDTITEHSEFTRSTLAKHCRRLAEEGDLELSFPFRDAEAAQGGIGKQRGWMCDQIDAATAIATDGVTDR